MAGSESSYVNLLPLTGKGMEFLSHLPESPHFPHLLVKFISEALIACTRTGFIRMPHFPPLFQK